MKKHLCVFLIIAILMSLITFNMGAYAFDNEKHIDITPYFNYDIFYKIGEAGLRNDVFPALIYDGGNIVENPLEIGTMSYNIQGNLSKGGDDCINVKNDTKVSLTNESVKNLGIIVATSSQESEIKVKIKYKNSQQEEHLVKVSPMSQKAQNSYDLGKGLAKGGTLMRPVTVQSSTDVYLNSYTIVPQRTSGISDLIFCVANSEYHIIAITELLYTQEELDNMSGEIIGESLSKYIDKTISDITINDTDELSALQNALLTAKENGDPVATDATIERISNLLEGFNLYNEKSEIYNFIQKTYETKDYRVLNATDITPLDTEILTNLIEKYAEAQKLDLQRLTYLLEYFGMTDNENINFDEKITIENLLSSYERLKYENELKSKIEQLYLLYADKDISMITQLDIPNLEKLISLYEESEENKVEFNEENANKIRKLYDSYTSYANSEKTVLYDLSAYFSGSVIATENEKGSKFGFVDSDGRVGYSKDIVSKWVSDNIITLTGNYNYFADKKNDPVLETVKKTTDFKLGSQYGATEKNAVILGNTEDKSKGILKNVTISGSTRMCSELYLLFAVARSDSGAKIVINYTDKTSYTQNILSLPWCAWGAHTGMYQNNKMILQDGIIKNATTDNPAILARGAYFPIEPGKIIKNIEITGLGGTALLAISEKPILNDTFLNLSKNAWEDVKDIDENNITAENFDKISTMVEYAMEGDARGIASETFAETQKLNVFRSIVLKAKHSVYRKNSSTINAQITFSTPVSPNDIDKYISISKNKTNISNYKLTLNDDKKKILIEIPDESKGGNEYEFIVSKDLKTQANANFGLKEEYKFSYVTSDSMTYSFANNKDFNITNYAKDTQRYTFFASVKSEDGKTNFYTESKSSILKENESESAIVDLSKYIQLGTSVFTTVWDMNQKTLATNEDIKKCDTKEVLSASYNEPKFSLSDNKLTVMGYTPTKTSDKIVNIKVEFENGNIIFVGSQKTNENGFFAYEIIVPNFLHTTSSNMNIYLGGDDFTSVQKLKSIYYSSQIDREMLIDDIKSKTSSKEILPLVSDIKKVLALDFPPSNAISNESFANAIYNVKNSLDKNDMELTQKTMKISSILLAFEQNKESVLFGKNDFLYDDIMQYSKIDSNGTTLYSIFKNDISDDGIAAIKKDILGKPYSNKDELMTKLKKSIFVNAFNYPRSGGSGYIINLITDKNSAEVKIDTTKYLVSTNKTQFNSALAVKKGTFNTIDEIENFIKNYDDSSPSIGGGSTSNSTGGGISSSMKTSNVEEKETVEMIFNDIPKTHWAYNNIMSLQKKGIISGKENNLFAPDDNVTRGEFVKILCIAYNLPLTYDEYKFEDVANEAWYRPYVASAYANGLVNGITQSKFGGELPISRQDICTILYRTKNIKSEYEINFADKSSIESYALEAVAFMANNGVIGGFSDNTFAPQLSCTRSQCAKIVDIFLGLK